MNFWYKKEKNQSFQSEVCHSRKWLPLFGLEEPHNKVAYQESKIGAITNVEPRWDFPVDMGSAAGAEAEEKSSLLLEIPQETE